MDRQSPPIQHGSSEFVLEVDQLNVRYEVAGWILSKLAGSARFLDAVINVSFNLRRGTTFAIVGESGSGKSSLGRAIMGLVPVASGSIRVGGGAPLGTGMARDKSYYRDVAMMFQDPISSLSPRRTVRSLISEPFIVHGLSDRDLTAEAERLLSLVGLPRDFATRYPHQLSGGQARRVGVARAIALSPRLIIADEPTAGLDVSVQGEVVNLLRRLQDELGLSYLLITHNLALVRHVSNRMAIMYMGRFVEQGATHEIFKRASHPYTAALLSAEAHPDPDRRRGQIPLIGEVPSLTNRPQGCEFHLRCPRCQPQCKVEPPRLVEAQHGRRYACHFPLYTV